MIIAIVLALGVIIGLLLMICILLNHIEENLRM